MKSSNPKLWTAEAIQKWLVAELATQMGISPSEIDIREPFDSYGLNSSQALVVAGKLENYLGFKLPPILLMYYPTIESLSQRLEEETETAQSEIIEL